MAQVYFQSIPVSEKQDARTLGSGNAWEVLEELREVGIDGLTVEEISKKVDLPKSTVYAILSKLQAAGYVEARRPRKSIGRPDEEAKREIVRTGKTKQIYVEKIPWPGFELEGDFSDSIMPVIEKVLKDHQLPSLFLDATDKILSALGENEESRKFLPSEEECPKCKESHEAIEFVSALGTAIMAHLISNKKMEPIYKKYKLNFSLQ